MQSLELAFFVVCAIFTIGGGLLTVGSRMPIRSAMGLLATIFGIAGCYLLLGAELLAAAQVIVYAGAVVVLFIFVVMLLGSAATSPSDAGSAVPRYIGAGTFLLSAFGALTLVLYRAPAKIDAIDGSAAPAKAAAEAVVKLPVLSEGFGSIEQIGHEIFTQKIVPFELTGALLLVAVVGAMAVARGKQPDPTRRNESDGAPGQDTAGQDDDGANTDGPKTDGQPAEETA
jgi:NADH-quinone oxidoreductase subunit J